MTNADDPSHGTDWWTMNRDGSKTQRLSYFNTNANGWRLGRKQVYATAVQAANWSFDDSYFYGDVETNLLTSDRLLTA
jgi:hypothetical protein